jgi:anti-sigma factor ChrR (cupin superfamily)
MLNQSDAWSAQPKTREDADMGVKAWLCMGGLEGLVMVRGYKSWLRMMAPARGAATDTDRQMAATRAAATKTYPRIM